jgi:hypothetical protein
VISREEKIKKMIKMIAREEKKIKKFKGSIDRKLILSERRYDKMAGIV